MFEILMIFFIYLISLNIAAFLGVGILSLFFSVQKTKHRESTGKMGAVFWQNWAKRFGCSLTHQLHGCIMPVSGSQLLFFFRSFNCLYDYVADCWDLSLIL